MITNTDGRNILRTDTTSNWSTHNPILANHELAIEVDDVGISFKLGDGTTAWNNLIYCAGAKSCPYQIGDIYCTLSTTKPSDRWINTTWEELPAGRALVAQGTYTENGETFNFSAGSTGGEAKHQLTIGEMPSHNHRGRIGYNQSGYGYDTTNYEAYLTSTAISTSEAITMTTASTSTKPTDINTRSLAPTHSTGDSGRHNNLQPYQAIYIYKRLN